MTSPIVGGEKSAAISQAEVERNIALDDLNAVRDILDPERIRLTAEQAAFAAISTRDYLMGEIALLRGRAENAEAQLQDAWREIACSDDIELSQTLPGAINQLQRARESAEVGERRYRFLKEAGIIRVFPVSSGMMSRGGTRILANTKDWLPGDFTYVIDGKTENVDAAIDAAIAQGKEQQG